MRIVPFIIKSAREAKAAMQDIGVDSQGIKIMSPKALHCCFKLEDISSFSANIIKQELLSLGSDAAIDRRALIKRIKTTAILFGSLYQMKRLAVKLKYQPFELKEVAYKLEELLGNIQKKRVLFKARGKVLNFNRPVVCGIINVTPDSFSGDGLLKGQSVDSYKFKEAVVKKAENMIKGGAKIIDVGGESSRPYSKRISEKEELRRVLPVIKILKKRFPRILISVDTYKYRVAKEAVGAGADIVNDITALRHSPSIASLIKRHKLGCVLMHMKGVPKTMQLNPHYKRGVVEEVFDFLNKRLEFCLKKGISREQIMIDPGIGFGKTVEDNYRLLNKLDIFRSLGVPVFLGVSRKSFIGKVLKADTNRRLYGTISALSVGYLKGADVLRVHDVVEAYEALKIAYLIKKVN